MAEFTLAVIYVHNPPPGSPFAVNDALRVYWDDSDSSIKVKKNDVLYTGPSGDIGVRGENYNFVYGISSYENNYAISVYSFCNSTTLNWFRMNMVAAAYPYFERVQTANSPVCSSAGGPVCDIIFNGPPVIVHATNLAGDNGSITVSAVSSNGTVKYAIDDPDFDYATGGQTSGTFSNLKPGLYTVYAKDTNDCTVQAQLSILYKPAEAEHYRFTWSDEKKLRSYTLRIYEREYTGSVVEINRAGESPFEIFKPRAENQLNNKFYPIHPSKARLVIENEYNYQFLPLFTQDQKRFRAVYEESTAEKWQGFIVPSVYQEPFIPPPYPSIFDITDNLKSLETRDFADDNGNLLKGDMKLIKVISFIMKKTGLELKIRSGINKFETNHLKTAVDDPLDQTYVDVTCYQDNTKPFTCAEVLEAILQPFGARIYQVDNCWMIEEIKRTTATYAYREFDSDGNYLSNSTFNPVTEILPSSSNQLMFDEVDHILEVIPAYGKINIKSKLNYTGSIVGGSFEKKDLLSPNSETFVTGHGIFISEEGFNGWTLRLPTGVSGVSFGRLALNEVGEDIDTLFFTGLRAEGKSVGAFYYNRYAWSGNIRDAYIESDAKPYQYGPGSQFKFSFEHAEPGASFAEFVTLRFVIKLGSQYLRNDMQWVGTESIFRAYVKPSDGLIKYELNIPLPDTTTVIDTTVQVRIYYYAKEFYDFGLPPSNPNDVTTGTDGETAFRAFATSLTYDYFAEVRRHITIGLLTKYYRQFYALRFSSESESATIIRPNDHATSGFVWALMGGRNESAANNNPGDTKFYIDNVSLDPLEHGREPIKETSISHSISKFIDETLDIELYNFDLPDITNGKNMYNNYFKLSTGAPTASWARTGITESKTLQEILLDELAASHSSPTFRITGSFYHRNGLVKPNNTLKYTKGGSNVSLLNTDFASNLNSWSQSGTGEAFVWTSANSGSAAVTLLGAEDSQKITQAISQIGGFIQATVQVHIIPAVGNDREDVLKMIYLKAGSVVHEERLKSFSGVDAEQDVTITHKAFLPKDIDAIGFFFKRVSGTGECTYQVSQFASTGTSIIEIYQIADYAFNPRHNSYYFELMQISDSYLTLQGTDLGGTGQNGDTGQYIATEGDNLILTETGDFIPLES